MNIVNDIQENYQTGYIKLFRSIKSKGWYKKQDYLHLWVHLLIKATHKGIEFFFNGENIKLNPGQFITGRKSLSIETGINESKIERILNFFEKNEHQIEQQKTNKNRLISIVNWNEYQNIEHQIEQQANNKRTTSEQQVNTYNNDNNINNDKEYIYTLYPSKCIISNRNTGKSKKKNESKIKTLLKEYSKEDLEFKIKWYIEECKKTKTYMKNFSTFLNNLPDVKKQAENNSKKFTVKHPLGERKTYEAENLQEAKEKYAYHNGVDVNEIIQL